jgi:hypothetical protein
MLLTYLPLSRWATAVLLSLLIAAPSLASPIFVYFSGTVTVTDSSGNLADLASGVAVGDRFSGIFSYEPQLLLNLQVPNHDIAQWDVQGFVSWNIGDSSDIILGDDIFFNLVNDRNATGIDTFGVSGEPSSVLGDIGYLDFDLVFRDLDGTVSSDEDFDNPFVPTPTASQFEGFDTGYFGFLLGDTDPHGHWDFSGTIDTIRAVSTIPEPSAAVLFAVGLIVVGRRLRG